MRKLAVFAVVAGLVVATAPALAHGPSGSTEATKYRGNTHYRYTNNVKCGKGTKVQQFVIYAGTNGVEGCAASGPAQGRIMAVNKGTSSYVAADGDRNNPNKQSRGWVRVDKGGVRCGDSRGRLDATHPSSSDTSADCG